jgi:hypothetical protein
LAYNEALLGDTTKRLGIFSRVQGRHSTRVNVSPGEHRIRVRIQSTSSGFDESRLVSQNFALNDDHTLHIKCDKRNNDLRLRFD